MQVSLVVSERALHEGQTIYSVMIKFLPLEAG